MDQMINAVSKINGDESASNEDWQSYIACSHTDDSNDMVAYKLIEGNKVRIVYSAFGGFKEAILKNVFELNPLIGGEDNIATSNIGDFDILVNATDTRGVSTTVVITDSGIELFDDMCCIEAEDIFEYDQESDDYAELLSSNSFVNALGLVM